MAKHLKKGDRVRWNTSQGPTTGRVKKEVKGRTGVGGTELKGSARDPVYVVESEKTGSQAGHKAGALRRT